VCKCNTKLHLQIEYIVLYSGEERPIDLAVCRDEEMNEQMFPGTLPLKHDVVSWPAVFTKEIVESVEELREKQLKKMEAARRSRSRLERIPDEQRLEQFKEYIAQEKEKHADNSSHIVLRPRNRRGEHANCLETKMAKWLNHVVSKAQGKNGAQHSESIQMKNLQMLKKIQDLLGYPEDDWWTLEKYHQQKLPKENMDPLGLGAKEVMPLAQDEVLPASTSGRIRKRPSWLQDTVILSTRKE